MFDHHHQLLLQAGKFVILIPSAHSECSSVTSECFPGCLELWSEALPAIDREADRGVIHLATGATAPKNAVRPRSVRP